MENVNAVIPAGAIVGIIGPNGAGKTTLFKMIVGEEKPDSGTVTVGTASNSPTWIRCAPPHLRKNGLRNYQRRP